MERRPPSSFRIARGASSDAHRIAHSYAAITRSLELLAKEPPTLFLGVAHYGPAPLPEYTTLSPSKVGQGSGSAELKLLPLQEDRLLVINEYADGLREVASALLNRFRPHLH